MDRERPVVGEFYRHFKGKLYQIKMLARDCDTTREVVVYQGMYPPFQCWTRDLQEFLSEVDKQKYPDIEQKYRFEKISENELFDCKKEVNKKVVKEIKYNNWDVDENDLVKALKSGQPERILDGKLTESEISLRGFMELLDAETFHEKRQIFIGLKQYLDKRMLGNIAVALDITLEDGSREEQFESILHCLDTFEHYEGGRLR